MSGSAPFFKPAGEISGHGAGDRGLTGKLWDPFGLTVLAYGTGHWLGWAFRCFEPRPLYWKHQHGYDQATLEG